MSEDSSSRVMTWAEELRDSNLSLVLAIKKHPNLYDYNLPEYTCKNENERTWIEISKKVGMSVRDCKEKWRNIRSSLVRSMKPSKGFKAKKPYYLAKYMDFILPYVKPLAHLEKINSVHWGDDHSRAERVSADENAEDADDFRAFDSKEQKRLSADEHVTSDSSANEENLASVLSRGLRPSRSTPQRHRRCALRSPLKRPHTIFLKGHSNSNSKAVVEVNPSSGKERSPLREDEAMRYFLLSLLPEFAGMTEHQKRQFKIKTLTLINEIRDPDRPISEL